MKSFFPNRTAKQIFFILFLGILLIFAAALIAASTFNINRQHRIRSDRVSQIMRLYRLNLNTPAHPSQKTLKLVRSPFFHVRISKQPLQAAQKISNPSIKNIKKTISSTKKPLHRLSLKLPENKWLNITIQQPSLHNRYILLRFRTLILITLLGLLFSLIVWSIKRLSFPMNELSEAANKLSRNIHTPLLAKTGNKEMDNVICAFNQMAEKIRELIHRRTQILAAISHDLRTPITRLKLRTEYLENTTQRQKMLSDLNEMENMIASVLIYARDQEVYEAKERFDLNALLESLCNDFEDADYQITYQSNVNQLPIIGSLPALKRAFTNIVDNSAKYGKQTHVKLNKSDKTTNIEITDDGPGIPEDALEKVFEPFYRANQSIKRKGSGLGLTIAKDIIDTHHGTIKLMNRSSGGLRVAIELPNTNFSKSN